MKSDLYNISSEKYPVLQETHVDIIPFFRNWVNVMMLFFPITSVVLIPSVQGTTIITILASLLFVLLIALPVGIQKWLFTKEFLVFSAIFAFFSIVSQFVNLLSTIQLSDELTLVAPGDYLSYFYRTSHATQALYIFIAYIIYLSIKFLADDSVIRYIYIGLRLLCAYGLYEVVFYLATGMKGDFLTNRQFGDTVASLTQIENIAGLQIVRMKSLTGEPSMFTFTVFPFWALTYGLNRKFDRNLLFFCLLLTFSTTAYAAMVLFHLTWFVYKKKYTQVIYLLLGLLVVLVASQMDAFREKFSSIFDFVFGNKFSSASSRGRSGRIENHIHFWEQLNVWGKTFGIGFGYIRSTDFFTTILVNNGWLGLVIFSTFFFFKRQLKVLNTDLGFAYLSGLTIVYLIMMATVPEFAYPGIWIFLALAFVINKFPNSPNFQVKKADKEE